MDIGNDFLHVFNSAQKYLKNFREICDVLNIIDTTSLHENGPRDFII